MNVKIIDRPHSPITTIFKAFRTCYSADVPTEIEIPMRETSIGDIPDKEWMIEFIKDKIDLGHESPLEHASFTFAIEGVSRALSHQLVRHRIASYSQQSQRYVKIDNLDIVTPDTIKNNDMAKMLYLEAIEKIEYIYKTLVEDMEIPKEDARYILPNATTTNLIITMNLRTFRHFLSERLCCKAQWEIRELANKMLEETENIVPFVGYGVKKCNVTCFQCKGE